MEIASQLAVNALIAGSQSALIASGFILIYRVTGVFHFAHGIAFVLGAYSAAVWGPLTLAEIPLVASFASLIASVFGVLCEVLVYGPLRRRGATLAGYIVASLGIYIASQNLLSIGFGDDTRRIEIQGGRQTISFLGSHITHAQVGSLLLSLALLVAVHLLLARSVLGVRWRACAENRELFRAKGGNLDLAFILCFLAGSVLAGTAGLSVGLDIDISPTRGMDALLVSFVIYVVAGKVEMVPIVAASFGLAFVQTAGTWFLGSEWRDGITFGFIALFLLFRPGGVREEVQADRYR